MPPRRNVVDPPLLPHLVTFQCMPSPIWPDQLVWIASLKLGLVLWIFATPASSSELDRWNARNLSGDSDQSQLDPVWIEDLKLSIPQQYGPRMLVINSQDLKSLKVYNVFLMSSSKPHFLFIQQVFNGWQFSQLATTAVDDCQCSLYVGDSILKLFQNNFNSATCSLLILYQPHEIDRSEHMDDLAHTTNQCDLEFNYLVSIHYSGVCIKSHVICRFNNIHCFLIQYLSYSKKVKRLVLKLEYCCS
uniref:Uncharacterized protein n=1 Tax=Oryza nivara TaxID=4536 RepID=A0A0E0JA16_ORYNI